MKILKGIVIVIGILFALFVVLVLVCAFHPELTNRIADFLYPDRKETAVEMDQDSAMGGSALPVGQGESGGENKDAEGAMLSVDPSDEKRDFPENEGDGIEPGILSEYTPPDEAQVEVPETLAGRTGYRQIQEEATQIREDEADRLKEQLSTGNTGDGLTFDARFYPYYAMLDEKGRHLYRQIYANGDQLFPVFAPVETVTAGQLRNVFSAVYNDHPELFWLETAYACKYRENGQCVEIELKFNRTAQDLGSAKQLFEEHADQILKEAQELPDHYGREKAVHDALIDKITYDMGAEMNQSAYSAMVNGRTVCAGYARAYQYLLQQLGIPCYYCTGYAGERHAWNIVALDDGYYNVDVTWDDSDRGRYDYFNKTDMDYAGSHMRQELSVYLPPCNGSAYRNLEQNPEDSSLRSIADLGMAEDQILTDMDSYYRDCHDQILQNGRGSYTFYNVIEDEQLLEEWHQAYEAERYKQAYMENAMIQLGISSCEMEIEIEELRGGKFLIIHKVSAW